MPTRGEYSTVTEIRSTYLSIVGTGDDALLLELLRSVCRDIDKACHQFFYPLIETRYFDPTRDVNGNLLKPDRPLLAVTTLTNGDSTAITSGQYVFEPRNTNDSPKWGIKLLGSSGVSWRYTTDPENALSLAGVWGYHANYSDAWVSTDTLGAAIASTSTTSATLTTSASLKAGQLIKIDSEFLYVSAVVTTTATIVRGVNGSTAATHLISAPIYVWTVDDSLAQLTKEATVARYRLRSNPLADNFVALDGSVLVNPKDIDKYITRRVSELGLVRMPL